MSSTPEPRARPVATASPARKVALSHLANKVRRGGEMFPIPVDITGLSPRDARLAEAIDRAATIRWMTLQAILEPMLKHPWNDQAPEVIAALLGGTTQLLLLDRVPDHAAISEAVGWCRTTKAASAAGVVNAILRNVTRIRGERLKHVDPDRPDVLLREDGSGWSLTQPIFQGSPLVAMAAQCGCHTTWLERIATAYSADTAREIAMHSIAEAPLILHGAGPHESLIDHDLPGFQVLKAGHNLHEVLTAFPKAIVQDTTAAAPVNATSAMAPQIALDRCAGRGTKSRQLAALHPSARIIACDTNAARLKDLDDLPETHVGRIEVGGKNPPEELRGKVDLLLLDVPCTNTGVLARRPEARHRVDPTTRTTLRDLQRQIAADALPWLSPTGTLVWATCSIEREENEAQVEWLTQWHPLQVVSMAGQTGTGLPGDPPTTWKDGGFFAMLRHRH